MYVDSMLLVTGVEVPFAPKTDEAWGKQLVYEMLGACLVLSL